jgi:hypothetical protein
MHSHDQTHRILHVFDDTIVEAGLHGGNSGFHTARGSAHDYRTARPAGFDGVQNRQAVCLAQAIIGDNDIDAFF